MIKAFEKSNRKKRHKLYLFFVSATQGDRSGYMPLAGEYGFIFNFGSNTNVIGHELAHGAFNLRHTFSDKAQYYLTERTTLNLMDYANGTELWKYQWDLIHNPETILLGFMQDESEGAKILIEKSDKFVGILERIRCAYKTNKTFDYDKPLGFVNGVLRHEGISLGDGHTYQEISLVMKDDVIACDPRNVSIDKKTNFYNFLFRGFSINVVGATDGQQLEKYLFDTSEAEYNTQQAKAIVKLHNELSKPTPDVDAATSLLYGLSDCALQQLTSTIREKSLALLLDGAGAYLPKWNERIIISLIRSALYDKGKAKSLYDCLCQKPALLYGLYDRTSVLRGEFIEALTLLCAQNWTQEQLDGLSADRYYITGSKELTLRSRFNDSKALDIWQLWANDNFKKSNSCKGIPPLSPVGLGDDCSSCSAGDIAYMPALYVQSLTDAADVQSIKALANAALTFAGATGSVNLLLNSSRLVKTLGVIELANLTADGVLANPLVRARLAQTENGKSFLQVWPYVNMGIDLATVSTDILVNFVNSGRKAAAVLDELPANNVANRLDEAEEVLRKRGVASAGGWTKYIDDFFANSKVINSKNRILKKGLDKVYTQLSVEEITAIHHYTTGAYMDFNAALRVANGNISALDEFNRAFYEILQSGMKKLPNKFIGQLYRGTSLSEEALLKYKNAFQNKTGVTEYPYTSTSQGSDVYEKFQNLTKHEGDMPVLIFVNAKGKYGVDIDGISRYGENFTELGGDLQSEVLFMSGSKFKVTEYVEDISVKGQKYVKMVWEEIP